MFFIASILLVFSQEVWKTPLQNFVANNLLPIASGINGKFSVHNLCKVWKVLPDKAFGLGLNRTGALPPGTRVDTRYSVGILSRDHLASSEIGTGLDVR